MCSKQLFHGDSYKTIIEKKINAYCIEIQNTDSLDQEAIRLLWPQVEQCLLDARRLNCPDSVIKLYAAAKDKLKKRQLSEQQRWALKAMHAARSQEKHELRGNLARELGFIQFQTGRINRSIILLRSAYRILKFISPVSADGALAELSTSYFGIGKDRLATKLASRVLARAIIELPNQARVSSNLAIQDIHKGHIAAAKMKLTQAAQVLSEDNPHSYSTTLANLARVELMLGNRYACKKHLDEAYEIAQLQGSLRAQCIILGNYVTYYAIINDDQNCEMVCWRALSVARNLGDRRNQLELLCMVSGLMMRQERFDETDKVLQEAFGIATSIKDVRSMATVLGAIASYNHSRGYLALAINSDRLRRRILAPLNDRRGRAIAAWNLAERYAHAGENRLARGAYRTAYHYFKENQSPRLELAKQRLMELGQNDVP